MELPPFRGKLIIIIITSITTNQSKLVALTLPDIIAMTLLDTVVLTLPDTAALTLPDTVALTLPDTDHANFTLTFNLIQEFWGFCYQAF